MIAFLRHPILTVWRWLMHRTNLHLVEGYMDWMASSFQRAES